MKIEYKNKVSTNTMLTDVIAFRITGGNGFLSEDDGYLIIWWDGEHYPTVYCIENRCQGLVDCLMVQSLIDSVDDIIKIYTDEDQYDLIFREL